MPTGALLGFLCLWLWPDRGRQPARGVACSTARSAPAARWRARYAVGALVLGALGALARRRRRCGCCGRRSRSRSSPLNYACFGAGRLPEGRRRPHEPRGARCCSRPTSPAPGSIRAPWTRARAGAGRGRRRRMRSGACPIARDRRRLRRPSSTSAPSCRAARHAGLARVPDARPGAARRRAAARRRRRDRGRARARARCWSAARSAIRAAPPRSRPGWSRPAAPPRGRRRSSASARARPRIVLGDAARSRAPIAARSGASAFDERRRDRRRASRCALPRLEPRRSVDRRCRALLAARSADRPLIAARWSALAPGASLPAARRAVACWRWSVAGRRCRALSGRPRRLRRRTVSPAGGATPARSISQTLDAALTRPRACCRRTRPAGRCGARRRRLQPAAAGRRLAGAADRAVAARRGARGAVAEERLSMARVLDALARRGGRRLRPPRHRRARAIGAAARPSRARASISPTTPATATSC